MAEIKPIVTQQIKLHPFDLCKGDFVVPDDFDEPPAEEIIRKF